MRRGAVILPLIFIVIALASLGAAAFFYLSLDEEKSKAKLVASDLESSEVILEKTKSELATAKNEAGSLTEKNKAMSEELTTLKKSVSQLELDKGVFSEKVEQLSAQNKILQAQVEKVMSQTQEQIALQEQALKKQLEAEKTKQLIKERALAKQVESSELLLDGALKKNKMLNDQLRRNQVVLDEIHRDKLGQQLLLTRDELMNKEQTLQNMIAENEDLMKSFQVLEAEKVAVEDEVAQLEDQIKKQTAKFHYNLGVIYDQSKRPYEAAKEYQQVLKLVPDDSDTHYNLGILYDEKLHDSRKAAYHYKTYLELNPVAKDAEQVEVWMKRAEQQMEWGKLKLFRDKDN